MTVDFYSLATYWSFTTVDPTGCWVWQPPTTLIAGDHATSRGPGRGHFVLHDTWMPANFVPWALALQGLVQNVAPSCHRVDCVRPEHQAVLLSGGLTKSEALWHVGTLTRCPRGHAFAGGGLLVIDRVVEGIYRGECRTCSEPV